MPEFRVSPLSIVNQIKSNLRDRYQAGFSILKELLQNADDAEADRFMIDALPGWPNAAKPASPGTGPPRRQRRLLSPRERTRHRLVWREWQGNRQRGHWKVRNRPKGLCSTLCDAFAVYAYGDREPFSTVVNPFFECGRRW